MNFLCGYFVLFCFVSLIVFGCFCLFLFLFNKGLFWLYQARGCFVSFYTFVCLFIV